MSAATAPSRRALDEAAVVACPEWCTDPPYHYVADDLSEPYNYVGHSRTVRKVVGTFGEGPPASARVNLYRADSYHPKTGYVRYDPVAIFLDDLTGDDPITPAMARELAVGLVEAAEIVDRDAGM